MKNYLKSAKLNPNSWEIFFLLGKTYLSISDVDRGVKCLKKSLSLCSRTENIELVCQYVSPGEALSLLHDYKRKSSLIQTLIKTLRIGDIFKASMSRLNVFGKQFFELKIRELAVMKSNSRK